MNESRKRRIGCGLWQKKTENATAVRIGNITPFTLHPLQRASWNTVSIRDTLHAVLWICTVYHQ